MYPYVWHWRKWPTESYGEPGNYKGMRCRVLVRGALGSALVEFENGDRFVTSRWGLGRRE